MEQKSNAAFSAHRKNGIYLHFPNGNEISTVWGVGTYSDNHDEDFDKFNEHMDSMSCEIMPITEDKELLNQIFSHFDRSPENDSVIGWVNITDWLWVLNQLANWKEGEVK